MIIDHGHAVPEETPSSLSHVMSKKTRTLLIVDKDPDILTAITDLVEGDYVRVLYADSVREAREIINREAADIIVADPASMGDEGAAFLNSLGSGTRLTLE